MPAPSPADLDRDLAAFFATDFAAPLDEPAFDRLALRLFAHQYETLAPYRAYCQRRGALPQRLRHWSEIPAVPVQAFKDARLLGEEDGIVPAPARVFRTSGTTSGGARAGEHAMSSSSLALYHASCLPAFRAFVLPELAAGGTRSKLVPLALGPSSAEAPHSSLWHMVDVVAAELFAEPARHFLGAGAAAGPGAAALDVAGLTGALDEASAAERAVCLFATDLGLDRFLTIVEAGNWTTRLPAGSRLVHTGGAKGRARALIGTAQLHARVAATLGVLARSCINEYGMTELASQFYDVTLRFPELAADEARLKFAPPWVRALVVDTHTLEPLPAGQPGLLRVLDLANRGSVAAILTEDRAVAVAPANDPATVPAALRPRALPFRLLGRAQGSEPRGCSLDAEVF
ncbi:MAG: hypothetical protein ABIP29_07185, partial [Candidatus Eisenbacteria bacterium]